MISSIIISVITLRAGQTTGCETGQKQWGEIEPGREVAKCFLYTSGRRGSLDPNNVELRRRRLFRKGMIEIRRKSNRGKTILDPGPTVYIRLG